MGFSLAFRIERSNDNTNWTPVWSGTGQGAVLNVPLAQSVSARYVRVTLSGAASPWWRIADFNLFY